jgi:hypothetical protein
VVVAAEALQSEAELELEALEKVKILLPLTQKPLKEQRQV